MDKLSFRPIELEDLSFLIEVRNECRQYLHDDRQFSLDDAKKWFSDYKPIFYIAEVDGIRIGYFRTSEWNFKNKNLLIGMDIHKDFRGRGLSEKFYIIFIDYLFEKYEFHKIKLKVLSSNPRAKHIYEKLGFKVEGVLKEDVLHQRTYIDSVVMSLFREGWERWKKLKNK